MKPTAVALHTWSFLAGANPTLYAAVDLTSAFPSTRKAEGTGAFVWQGKQYTFTPYSGVKSALLYDTV